MKISVLIPTMNRPEFLKKAVDAILTQSHEDFEIIIVDASNQHIEEINIDPRIIHVYAKKGIAESMNLALKIASGDIMVWANDDDMIIEDTFKYVVENLGDHQWCYGKIQCVDIDMHFVGEMGQSCTYEMLKGLDYIPQPSVYWTRKAYETVGGFDESFEHAVDYYYWLRLYSKFEPIFFNRMMAFYTMHDTQGTKKYGQNQIEEAGRIKEFFKTIDADYEKRSEEESK